jgi:hypothetical protein
MTERELDIVREAVKSKRPLHWRVCNDLVQEIESLQAQLALWKITQEDGPPENPVPHPKHPGSGV